ncbi:MAG: hypothetical protein TREMPRED_002976 [Tremellales sp. Tagirdzhanova-0007]|nr:MAG: hypothetical protein TREMPRED_002976 [Tremellales sp. Tagirdzhanova-0007]
MFGFAGKLVTLALLSTQSCTFAYQVPTLDYAFTITSFNQAIGSPIALQGYNQTVGIGVNSTISGPLLNATLVTLSFTEQVYNTSANGSSVSYSTSQASAIYRASDGSAFALQQTGAASSKADVVTLALTIGGDYAYLSQYVIICYTPVVTGSNFTSTTSTSPMSTSTSSMPASSTTGAGPAVKGQADCFVVGGI